MDAQGWCGGIPLYPSRINVPSTHINKKITQRSQHMHHVLLSKLTAWTILTVEYQLLTHLLQNLLNQPSIHFLHLKWCIQAPFLPVIRFLLISLSTLRLTDTYLFMVSNRHSDQYSLRSLPLLIIMIIICYGLLFTFVLTFRSTETVSLDPDPDDEASLTATAQALLQNPIVFQLSLDPEDKYHIFWTLDYKSESATIEVRTQLHSQTDWFAIGFSDYGNITNADLCIFWFDLHQKSHFDVSAPQNIPLFFLPFKS